MTNMAGATRSNGYLYADRRGSLDILSCSASVRQSGFSRACSE